MKFKNGDLVYIMSDLFENPKRNNITGKIGKIIRCVNEYGIYAVDIIDCLYYVNVYEGNLIKVNCE